MGDKAVFSVLKHKRNLKTRVLDSLTDKEELEVLTRDLPELRGVPGVNTKKP